ncbi:MAG: ABC transporter ATP-binding protein [Candidatus Brocadiaceae bacterium]
MGLLEVRNVSLSLDGQGILHDLSLTVERGAIHALVGPNGAGKTTLAYAVMGLPDYTPDCGDIVFDGERINDLCVDERARRGLSLAWQEPARFEGLKVRDFLQAGRARKPDRLLREALQKVALEPGEYMDRAVDESLSGGERKRIELASILVMQPKLMITDEPDSGIDVEALRRMFELFDALRAEETTLLLVTHSSEVMAHADSATLMCCGRKVEEGPAEEIRRYFVDRCVPCPFHDVTKRDGEG